MNHESPERALAITLLATMLIMSVAINVFSLVDWIKAKPVEVMCSVQIVDNADLRHEVIGKGWIYE